MKPNFLVIGAPKAATTALCSHLGKHPDVFMCQPKEPFFFAYDDVYARGWAWYENLFARSTGRKAIGEGSTVYSQLGTYPKTLERIVHHVPEVRIIYAVRHPLERIQSHWVEMTSQGLTRRMPFNEAVRRDPQYIDASSYHRQLSAYLDHFAPERVLVLFYEDFRADAHQVVRRCLEFLDVDPDFEVPEVNRPIYTSTGKRGDKPVTNLLRRYVPGFMQLRDRMPPRLRELAKRHLKETIPGKPEWDAETRAFALRALSDDSRRFLEHCGKPPDYWGADLTTS